MAYAQGLGTFYTGFLVAVCQRDNSIGRLLDIPRQHRIYGGLALGYPKFEFNKWIERKTPKVSWL